MAIRQETGLSSAPEPKPIVDEQAKPLFAKPASLTENGPRETVGKPLSGQEMQELVESPALVSERPLENQSIVLFTPEKKRSIKQALKELREKKQKLKEKALQKEDQFMSKLERKLTKAPTNSVLEKSPSFFERKFGRTLDRFAAWEFLSLVDHQIVDNVQRIYPVGYEEKLGEIMADPNTILFTFSNHQSIAEIEEHAMLSQKNAKIINKARGFDDSPLGRIKRVFNPQDEKNRFPGTVITYAKSLTPEGKLGQGGFVEQVTMQLKNRHIKEKFFMEPFVREKDKKKYGLSIKDNTILASKFVHYIKNGFAIDSFTPGTVEESRFIDEEGAEKHRKGLQELDCTQYFRLMELAERLGKKCAFLNVGMDGGNNIIDPAYSEEPIPTKKAIRALFDPRNSPGIRTVLKLFHLENKPLMTVRVGMPMSKEEVMQQIKENYGEINLKNVNSYTGHGLAKLLPPEARGVYA